VICPGFCFLRYLPFQKAIKFILIVSLSANRSMETVKNTSEREAIALLQARSLPSTVREVADKDYQLTVLSDLCADVDSEPHSILINKIFPRQAEVMTGQERAATLQV
jgi:hypothetical protein